MPLVIAWLPLLELNWLADEAVHHWLAGISFVLAVVAVVPGYLRHRRPAIPMLAVAGVTALASSAFLLPTNCCASSQPAAVDDCCRAESGGRTTLETLLTPTGGLLLVCAHVLNHRQCACCVSIPDGKAE